MLSNYRGFNCVKIHFDRVSISKTQHENKVEKVQQQFDIKEREKKHLNKKRHETDNLLTLGGR